MQYIIHRDSCMVFPYNIVIHVVSKISVSVSRACIYVYVCMCST